ncbi:MULTISPECIES: class F sortase [Brachybacterium]|uniref:class F sortase n=1 Tax=Brachybacterium TaxID=43668 RepID=UPI00197AF73B|nr:MULTISPECIES: class F sortase [Brachybacterium]MCW1805990.1 class F sortase [Brachybacterium squillarum]
MARSMIDTPRGGRPWATTALGVLCMVGLLLVVVALLRQEPAPPQAPTVGAGTESSASASDPGSTSRPTTPESSQPTSTPEATPTALPASEPTRVRLDGRGIDGNVFPISLADDGTLPAPSGARKDDAAWYDGSPTPGQPGPSVIEGHVTYGGEPSVFFELGAVQKGDRVTVDREDGRTAAFEVYDVARFPKDAFPTEGVYGNTAGPELRLITCGGSVDGEGRHADNVIVFARLVDDV